MQSKLECRTGVLAEQTNNALVSTMPPSTPKRVFVTVGSTKFDALIQQALTDALLQTFCDNGFTDLVIQAGNSVLPASWTLVGEQIRREIGGLTVTVWKFKGSLTEDIERADLVVSHAGAWLSFCFISF